MSYADWYNQTYSYITRRPLTPAEKKVRNKKQYEAHKKVVEANREAARRYSIPKPVQDRPLSWAEKNPERAREVSRKNNERYSYFIALAREMVPADELKWFTQQEVTDIGRELHEAITHEAEEKRRSNALKVTAQAEAERRAREIKFAAEDEARRARVLKAAAEAEEKRRARDIKFAAEEKARHARALERAAAMAEKDRARALKAAAVDEKKYLFRASRQERRAAKIRRWIELDRLRGIV